jgi:hypothetical protein
VSMANSTTRSRGTGHLAAPAKSGTARAVVAGHWL